MLGRYSVNVGQMNTPNFSELFFFSLGKWSIADLG